jgi:uncharacterized membrane protein
MTQPSEPNLPEHNEDASQAPDTSALTPQWPSQAGPAQAAGDQMYGGQPIAPPPAYGPTPQTSNSAVVALVLSIAAWVICPIIPAIVALVFANKADKEIAAGNGWVTGGGLVTASKIVAWINIGLYAALLAIGVLVLILAVVGGAFSSM